MKRKVDRTKKSNRKCEHCKYFHPDGACMFHQYELKNYWNVCKDFDWR
jgi:hypothetical protein